MNKFKLLSIIFLLLAIVISNVMCASVAFNYCNMLWGIEYKGYSAPASVAFFNIIPYAIIIIICIILSFIFWKKSK